MDGPEQSPKRELLSAGERWFEKPTSMREDLAELWGDWGVDSEVGRLRAVLMRRPGKEVEGVTDPAGPRWLEVMDPEKARAQHDALAGIYHDNGVAVHYIEEMRPDRPNAFFVRDLVLMTPEGAILARPAMATRRGEEAYAARALAKLGVPIIKTVCGQGTFEGANVLWIDRKTVFLGVGNRTNAEGARQVEEELRNVGVEEVIQFQVPFGQAHIDGICNLADRDVAVLFPWQVPHVAAEALLNRGYRILEVAWPEEAKLGMAINFVALEPGKIVMPSGCPRSREIYEKAGLTVIEADISELRRGWGSIHCMTGFLKRDPVQ